MSRVNNWGDLADLVDTYRNFSLSYGRSITTDAITTTIKGIKLMIQLSRTEAEEASLGTVLFEAYDQRWGKIRITKADPALPYCIAFYGIPVHIWTEETRWSYYLSDVQEALILTEIYKDLSPVRSFSGSGFYAIQYQKDDTPDAPAIFLEETTKKKVKVFMFNKSHNSRHVETGGWKAADTPDLALIRDLNLIPTLVIKLKTGRTEEQQLKHINATEIGGTVFIAVNFIKITKADPKSPYFYEWFGIPINIRDIQASLIWFSGEINPEHTTFPVGIKCVFTHGKPGPYEMCSSNIYKIPDPEGIFTDIADPTKHFRLERFDRGKSGSPWTSYTAKDYDSGSLTVMHLCILQLLDPNDPEAEHDPDHPITNLTKIPTNKDLYDYRNPSTTYAEWKCKFDLAHRDIIKRFGGTRKEWLVGITTEDNTKKVAEIFLQAYPDIKVGGMRTRILALKQLAPYVDILWGEDEHMPFWYYTQVSLRGTRISKVIISRIDNAWYTTSDPNIHRRLSRVSSTLLAIVEIGSSTAKLYEKYGEAFVFAAIAEPRPFLKMGSRKCDQNSCYKPASDYKFAPLIIGQTPDSVIYYLKIPRENKPDLIIGRAWGRITNTGMIMTNVYPNNGGAVTQLMKKVFDKVSALTFPDYPGKIIPVTWYVDDIVAAGHPVVYLNADCYGYGDIDLRLNYGGDYDTLMEEEEYDQLEIAYMENLPANQAILNIT